tara:strand:+ start:5252 stop:6121 length:870 start_codon:yes stop_codon:yes gene_type:complete
MDAMDIDTFIDELEKVCDCPNQGYIKCLEKVKELKEEAEQISWKSIAKQKTQTLQEFFPDYNPTFQTCPDEEAIRDMLKKVFDENEKLKGELYYTEQEAEGFRNEYPKLKEEIESLKELCMSMCEQLQEATKHIIEDPTKFYRGIEAVEETQEENEKLKAEIEIAGSVYTDFKLMKEERDGLKEEWKDLTGEIEKIENEKDYWEKEYHELKLKVDWGDIDDYSRRIDELVAKNNELYAENKKLKDEKPPKDLYECRQRLEKHRKELSKLLKIEDTFKHQELRKVLNKKD